MTTSLVALGANLGSREQSLTRAAELLASTPGVGHVRLSSFFATAPIGGPAGQPEFQNAALRLASSLSALELHARLQAIEESLGRRRGERWAARPIDLDLLLHGDEIIETPELRVPHPRMAVRRFVLEPAVEIAAELVHPELQWSVERLWRHLQTATPRLAVAGRDAERLQSIVAQLAERGCLAPRGDWTADIRLGLAELFAPEALAPKLVAVLQDEGGESAELTLAARRRVPTIVVRQADGAVAEIAAALESMR